MKKAYLHEISKFKEPPLIGLANIGATCYMNATLQCLSNINLLTGYFLFKKQMFQDIPIGFSNKEISKAYSDVVYHLWNPNEPKKYYTPNYFKQVISSKNKLFEGIQANDSKDLLIFLYENIHKELNERTRCRK
jgi:ubiquitin carboxyl-terminal hydrolase 4/11/15